MNGAYELMMGAFSRAAADGRPVVALDEHRRCLLSGCRERLAEGECIDSFLLPALEHNGAVFEGSLCRAGHMYCVRYIGINGMYIGEILSADEVSFLAEYTDGMNGHAALYSSLEYVLSVIWQKKHALERMLTDSGNDVQELIYQLERPLYRVSANSRNVYEYLNMMRATSARTVVDMVKLCSDIVQRCNETLGSSGRRVECRLPQSEKLYIRADVRHAVAAVLNAVQNALIYSPKNSVPMLEVRRSGRRIFITVENENIRASGKETACTVRSGYGIPIIRRFVSLTDGELRLSLEGDIASVQLDVPAATEEDIAEYALEEAVLYRFEDGAPDYVQLQMMMVADMYLEPEKTGNVQYSVT